VHLAHSVKGRPHYYSTKKEEYAIIKFSLDADLSSLFTWNTKQLFVYVTAEWTNPTSPAHPEASRNQTNEAVIWDSIITAPTADRLLNNVGPATLKKLVKSAAGRAVAPERAVLALKNQKPKYQITHPTGRVAATADDVVLRVHYNVQPWVGLLTWDQTVRDYGAWKRVEGGASEPFAFPALKKKDEAKKAKA
jgi:signal peptidase complex subunit 3